MLAANVRGGTGTGASLPTQVAAGKTGTTEDFGDAWFVGFTPHLATAVWMGNPDTNTDKMVGLPVHGSVTGGSFPAQAFRVFNTAYHERLEPEPFPTCPGFARAGKYQKLEGDVPIGNSPCPSGSVVLSVNGERSGVAATTCPIEPNRVVTPASSTTTTSPVPLYCIETRRRRRRMATAAATAAAMTEAATDGDGGGDGGGATTAMAAATMVARLMVARPMVARPMVARPMVVRPMVARLMVARLMVARLMVARLMVARLMVARPMVVRLMVVRPMVARLMVARPMVVRRRWRWRRWRWRRRRRRCR